MMMKKFLWAVPCGLALFLAACGQAATPSALPTVSLDTGPTPASNSGSASASAIIVPVTKVELSFPTAGTVKSVEVVAGDQVKAGQPLVVLETAILEARVAEAQANVVTQSTTLKYLQRTIEVGASPERIQAAQADIDRATAAVDIARAQLAQATLAAPFDGTIASVEISPAEFAQPGQIMIVMGDLTHFRVETTDLSEKDIASVKTGQTASVFIDALAKEFNGHVVDIARVSKTVGGDVVYTVTVELDEQPAGLRWGMSAEVLVKTE